jgi:hypothetical protein
MSNGYQLPDDFDNRTLALCEQAPGGGCLWLQRGKLIHEYQLGAPKHGRVMLQQRAADVWGVALSTVREDWRNARDLGDWCDEMPFEVSRAQIRCAKQEASLREVDSLVVLQERANDVDKWGGRLCPPRAWKAQIKDLRDGKKTDDGADVVGRIRAAASALATALKRSEGQKRFDTYRQALEDLATNVNILLDEVERA